jgi:hypothetical protein
VQRIGVTGLAREHIGIAAARGLGIAGSMTGQGVGERLIQWLHAIRACLPGTFVAVAICVACGGAFSDNYSFCGRSARQAGARSNACNISTP